MKVAIMSKLETAKPNGVGKRGERGGGEEKSRQWLVFFCNLPKKNRFCGFIFQLKGNRHKLAESGPLKKPGRRLLQKGAPKLSTLS